MGQYYKAIALNEDKKVHGWASSYDYNNGAKLMEHSWIGNSFVGAAERQLIEGGAWYKKPIVWGGDYADPETSGTTLFMTASENETIKLRKGIRTINQRKYKYVVNHDTKQFVNKTKVPVTSTWTDPKTGKTFKFQIHPLPLLTCEGNGRGGGDYRDDNPLVGTWARNHISIESRIPAGYTELKFDLTE